MSISLRQNPTNDLGANRPVALLIVLFLFIVPVSRLAPLQQLDSWVPLSVKHVGPPEFFNCEIRARIKAPLEVALVFRRAPGCQDADLSLINLVARQAINAGIHPKLLAATVAVESGCNPQAVSYRGALGLTQVVASAWDEDFDFSRVNLLDESENLRTGAIILAKLIRSHGLYGGVRHYNGAATDCPSCEGYSARVLGLAAMNGDEISSITSCQAFRNPQ